jgi:hypothetical protein
VRRRARWLVEVGLMDCTIDELPTAAETDKTDKTVEAQPDKPEEPEPKPEPNPEAAQSAKTEGTDDMSLELDVSDPVQEPTPKPSSVPEVNHRLLAFAKVMARRLLHNLAEWIICFQDSFLGGEGTGHTAPNVLLLTHRVSDGRVHHGC